MRRAAPALRWLPPIAPLGFAAACALLTGALIALQQAALPTTAVLVALLVLGVLLWLASARLRVLGAVTLGFALTALHGQSAMQSRLPEALQGVDLQVEGRIDDLPRAGAGSTRFDFVVEVAADEAAPLRGKRLRLSWYGSPPDLGAGSRWQLQVRLKRPRGVLNPGGFDFERHALERRIAATGYVREHPDNRRLAPAAGVDAVRERISRRIEVAVGAPASRFVQALAVGDSRALDDDDWAVLRATGIAHLIAISGLHVGLVAGFAALLTAGLHRLWPPLGLRIPLPQSAAAAALLAASGYTALAGFALPTVRTLLMIAAALLAIALRRQVQAWQSLALALIAVLLFDPLSLLGAGFWLSFLGVAWLIWCLPRERGSAAWRALLGAQAVMSLSLLPLTVWFFGQASVIGPLANLIAVPWVSFVVVPLALAGTALAFVSDALASALFVAAATLMQWLWALLEPAAGLRGALVYLPAPSTFAFVLALIGAFWLLLPRAVPGKGLAILLFLPLIWPAPQRLAEGEVDLWVLDVGQGLSVLVRTRDHALLYDAGPAQPGGLDMGDAVVVPALRALAVDALDTYVESHGDNDHAGGSDSVIRAYAPATVLASDPGRVPGQRCEAGQAWQWNGVQFRILHPTPHFPYLGNDSSCVLRIDAVGASALLTGDISEVIEQRLGRDAASALRADLLLVPHHGSASSSSEAFIAAVAPRLALIGVGHRNRFGLPREPVLARYRAAGVALEDTAHAGALQVRLGRSGLQSVQRWREQQPRFWRERDPPRAAVARVAGD
jgi:competence protein ComEC